MKYTALKKLGKGLAIAAVVAMPYICDTCSYHAQACYRSDPNSVTEAKENQENLEKLIIE